MEQLNIIIKKVDILPMVKYYIDQLEWRITMKKVFITFIFLSIFISLPISLHAENTSGLSNEQTIYVPAYSVVYVGDRERPFLLTVTLNIRNIDPKNTIKIMTVDYYETRGSLLKRFLDKPISLNPLESKHYVIPEKEKAGGSGANFIVKWKSDKLVNPPIAESVMIGTRSGQGISFSSRGQVIIATD